MSFTHKTFKNQSEKSSKHKSHKVVNDENLSEQNDETEDFYCLFANKTDIE